MYLKLEKKSWEKGNWDLVGRLKKQAFYLKGVMSIGEDYNDRRDESSTKDHQLVIKIKMFVDMKVHIREFGGGVRYRE